MCSVSNLGDSMSSEEQAELLEEVKQLRQLTDNQAVRISELLAYLERTHEVYEIVARIIRLSAAEKPLWKT